MSTVNRYLALAVGSRLNDANHSFYWATGDPNLAPLPSALPDVEGDAMLLDTGQGVEDDITGGKAPIGNG
jgi:hypothetical protein